MYMAIYCVVIALFCGGFVAFFILKNNKDKKRYDQLRGSVEIQKKPVELNASVPADEAVQPVAEIQSEPQKVDAELEDFALDVGEQVEKKKELKPLKLNPFEAAEELAEADEDEIDDENDFEIDDQFAEYEEFLKKSMQMHEDEFDEDEELADEDEISRFDLNQLNGKSDVEIAEILKNLPPKMQEIIMTNILGRKDFEDED